MGIPNFQSLLLPMLRVAGEGQAQTFAQARARLASEFNLTAAEQEELAPSLRQPLFVTRIAWAALYLQRAGLLRSPDRHHLVISDRGREVLAAPPERIDMPFLEQCSGIAAFGGRHRSCGVCSQLKDREDAFQKGGREEEATYLPAASQNLELVRDVGDSYSRQLQLKRCPQCQTYYLYQTDYEFIVPGTEDWQWLRRLTDAEADEYSAQPVPPDVAKPQRPL